MSGELRWVRMRRTWRRVLCAVLVAGGAAGLGACSPPADGRTEQGTEAGYVSGDSSVTTWPTGDRVGPVELSGTDFTGAPVDISDWRGDVVVLNTWYAACPPCRAEAPDLVEISQEYAPDGVRFLGINSRDDAGAAQPFERTFAVPYPSLEDRRGIAVAALQGTVPVQAVPTTVVLDRDGRVAARILGLADPSTLRALLDETLVEPSGGGA